MATSFPRQWTNASFVFVQQRAVSRYARETGQSRQTVYRDARRVSHELQEGQRMHEELQRRNRELQAENTRLKNLLQANPFHDPDKVSQFAAMAQAEGVSLPVARRLLTILQGTKRRR